MKRVGTLGYTLVELMIFLAITATLTVIILRATTTRQSMLGFEQSMQTLQQLYGNMFEAAEQGYLFPAEYTDDTQSRLSCYLGNRTYNLPGIGNYTNPQSAFIRRAGALDGATPNPGDQCFMLGSGYLLGVSNTGNIAGFEDVQIDLIEFYGANRPQLFNSSPDYSLLGQADVRKPNVLLNNILQVQRPQSASPPYYTNFMGVVSSLGEDGRKIYPYSFSGMLGLGAYAANYAVAIRHFENETNPFTDYRSFNPNDPIGRDHVGPGFKDHVMCFQTTSGDRIAQLRFSYNNGAAVNVEYDRCDVAP